MNYLLLEKNEPLQGGPIPLPGSKSISNRLLLMQALSLKPFQISNLSRAADTLIMAKALYDTKAGKLEIDAGEAGTVARFLAAYLALLGEFHILKGSPRLQERPMAPLVEALRKLGAQITYLGKEGHLPLKFEGGKLYSKHLEVSASWSSQFFSALLMIAPLLPDGLTLKADAQPVSSPYINMTLGLMRQGGIEFQSKPDEWTIFPGRYSFSENLVVESDWSAAAPWMVFSLLGAPIRLHLHGLYPQSLQGDSKGLHFFQSTEYQTFFDETGLHIETHPGCSLPSNLEYDFSSTPDLALSFIAAAAARGCRGKFSGLQTLSHKESDRFRALINELSGFGFEATAITNHTLLLKGQFINKIPSYVKTYNDHRMAMAFAPWVLLTQRLCIENPLVVSKSYPDFWNHLSERGITLTFYDTPPSI